MSINPEQIKNILILRNDRFGEFLLNIPALRALKETFINSRIIAAVDPYVQGLAKDIPFIDEVIEWGGRKHSLSARLKLIARFKKKKIDMAIMLNPSKEFNILTWFAGIPVRVGYDRKWGFLLTHKIKDKKHLGEKHEIEYNLELVRITGAETKDLSLSLRVEEGIIERLPDLSFLENYKDSIALHPWTSDPVKQWPLNNFRELAGRLVGEIKAKVVVVGGKEEASKGEELFGNLGNNPVNLTGKTNLRELAAILNKCRMLISCDSGPVHLAGCVGIPVVAIFRNDLPGKTSRRWGPVSRGSIVIEKGSLGDISVEEVFLKAREILEI